jgi:hypothetical protein
MGRHLGRGHGSNTAVRRRGSVFQLGVSGHRRSLADLCRVCGGSGAHCADPGLSPQVPSGYQDAEKQRSAKEVSEPTSIVKSKTAHRPERALLAQIGAAHQR